MKTVNKVNKANKAKRTPSKAQQLQSKATKNHKDRTFSMNGLIRYAKGDGRADLEAVINEANSRLGTNFSIKQVTARLVLANMSDYERLTKSGEQKKRHSFHYLQNAVKRAIKASK